MTEEKIMKMSLDDFSPAREALMLLAEKAKAIDVTVFDTVHETRMQLREARVSLTKRGKEMREGAMRFQKEVIAKERDMLAIIEPEETRLEKIEAELKLRKDIEDRRSELPSRIAALASIGDDIDVDEDELLAMSDTEFNEYRLRRIDAKLEKNRQEFEAEKKAAEETARRLAAEEDAKRRAQVEEDERKIREAQAEANAAMAVEREKLAVERMKLDTERKAQEEAEQKRIREVELKEREEKLAAERQAREDAEAAQKEADIKREEAFQAWLKEVGFDQSQGDVLQTAKDGIITAYRPIGWYDPKKK